MIFFFDSEKKKGVLCVCFTFKTGFVMALNCLFPCRNSDSFPAAPEVPCVGFYYSKQQFTPQLFMCLLLFRISIFTLFPWHLTHFKNIRFKKKTKKKHSYNH